MTSLLHRRCDELVLGRETDMLHFTIGVVYIDGESHGFDHDNIVIIRSSDIAYDKIVLLSASRFGEDYIVDPGIGIKALDLASFAWLKALFQDLVNLVIFGREVPVIIQEDPGSLLTTRDDDSFRLDADAIIDDDIEVGILTLLYIVSRIRDDGDIPVTKGELGNGFAIFSLDEEVSLIVSFSRDAFSTGASANSGKEGQCTLMPVREVVRFYIGLSFMAVVQMRVIVVMVIVVMVMVMISAEIIIMG